MVEAIKKYPIISSGEAQDHIKDSQFGSNLIGYIDQVHGRSTLEQPKRR